MTSQFYRECLRKKRYKSENTALSVAQKVFDRSGVITYVYYCPICLGFHLTKNRFHSGRENTRVINVKGSQNKHL